MSDVDSKEEFIFTIYPDQIINHIPNEHAKRFYEKLERDKSLNKFKQTDVKYFLNMLQMISVNKWIGFEFDWN